MVTEDGREPVATFQVNDAGQARVEFELPQTIDAYSSAMVTMEPIGSTADEPAGPEVLISSGN